MQRKKYRVEYLPVARDDIDEAIDYILNTLNAPIAAERLAGKLDEKARLLETQPYTGTIYKGIHKLNFDYRCIFVGNYTVFYVIYESEPIKRVEIHRVVYSARNMGELI